MTLAVTHNKVLYHALQGPGIREHLRFCGFGVISRSSVISTKVNTWRLHVGLAGLRRVGRNSQAGNIPEIMQQSLATRLTPATVPRSAHFPFIFATDIRNALSPMFTGPSAMMQNLPFMKRPSSPLVVRIFAFMAGISCLFLWYSRNPMDLQETMGKPLDLALLKAVAKPADVNNTTSGVVEIHNGFHVSEGCTSPPCGAEPIAVVQNGPHGQTAGCYSFCCNMVVHLPQGAQVTEIHYYFEALAGGWYETQPGVDLMWAMILPANITTDPGGSVTVSATFKNWSESATRHGSITVGWHLPH